MNNAGATRRSRHYGTLPDAPDRRDRVYVPKPGRRLPGRVDLISRCPPVYDQKTLNSCSANALAAAVWCAEPGTRRVPASRLFLYYNERAREGTTASGAPVSLRDGFRSLVKQGVCPESMWPYRVSKFARRPPAACYRTAARRKATSYERLERKLAHLKACLADGYPFAMAMVVYKGFESRATARTGDVPVPRGSERPIGGHAVLVVGYEVSRREFVVRNSWGPHWGRHGYFRLPFEYVLDERLVWDFWTLRKTGCSLRVEICGRAARNPGARPDSARRSDATR